MSKLVVESGVPIPPDDGRGGRGRTSVFYRMEHGQSVVFSQAELWRVSQATTIAKKRGMRVTRMALPDGSIRLWMLDPNSLEVSQS